MTLQYLIKRFSIAIALSGALFTSMASAAVEAPDVFIKRIIAGVLNDIETTKIKSGDLVALNNLVDQKIIPNLDFARMTQLTVGKYWREATPEQRNALMKEFKILLTSTYASALNQVKTVKVRYRPTRYVEGDTESEVRSSISAAGAEPVEVSYRLSRENDSWKVYDLNIAGLWLLQNYKTSFEREIGQGGIDQLINNLSKKNKELAARHNNQK